MAIETQPVAPGPADARSLRREEISGLARQISEAEEGLSALLGGQIDMVLNPITGAPILLQEAQQALLRSEARYRALANILKNVHEAIVVTDLSGTTTYWNDEAAALFGYSVADQLGRSLEVLYPNAGELAAQLNEIQAGRELRAVWAAHCANGSEVWVDARITAMRGEAGTITGGLFVFKDISERRQSQAAAKSTARHFQALIEKSADAITLLAADGTVLYTSAATARIMGGDAADWVGGNFFSRIHPSDAARLRETLSELVQTPGHSVTTVFRYQRLDESWRWLEGTGTNLLEDEAVGAIVANYRDITERKEAEEAARREHVLLTRIMDTSPVSIALINLDGQIVYANPCAIELLHLSKRTPDQAAYDTPAWTSFEYDGQPFPSSELPFVRVMASGQPVKDVRHTIELPDGQKRLLSINAAPVFDETGQIDGIVFTYEDVTQQVNLDKALRARSEEVAGMTQQLWQAAKLATLGELAASIAHELNNPLATISLRLEAMLHDLPAGAAERPPLVIVEAEVERMARMVSELLAFGRRQQPQVSTLDLGAEIDRALEFVAHRLNQRGVRVACAYGPDIHTVHADRQLLRQVFLNLLTNASDSMPDGGELNIRVSNGTLNAAPAILIEFADTGQGVAPEHAAEIWEPFYTTKPEGEGTGLGLAICRRIVHEHGGTISLDSAPGQGTVVRLMLPLTPPGREEASAAGASPASPDVLLMAAEAGPAR
jgi:PAS domain S-box-containing protein